MDSPTIWQRLLAVFSPSGSSPPRSVSIKATVEKPLGPLMPSKGEGVPLESSTRCPPLLHCLVYCPFAEEVWHRSEFQSLTAVDEPNVFWTWWSIVIDKLKSQSQWRRKASSVVTVLWKIWCDRNVRVFEGISNPPDTILSSAQSLIAEYFLHHPP
ncbi:hypothetical protein PIB30_049202 [Stylosanthes scabra]|uniref:Uncharacterized protein n=1 Tax=Stylosanthes scabra TaxID=79078 RepID=A0ABU6WFP4_9FABA|nr:hypothetical protein [Stylosanthes scabra]